MEASASPPTYEESISSSSSSVSEKQQAAPPAPQKLSDTPLLDAHFKQPNIRQHLLTLSGAIGSLGDNDRPTKPSAQSIKSVLMAYGQDLKAAKKNGSLSREDQKAMKREGRTLLKGLKKDFRS